MTASDPRATLIKFTGNFQPIESRGYWTAIFSFELWLFFAGLCLGIGQPGAAAFFLSWNAVRLYQSPFLKFALTRSIPFILASGVASALGVSVYAATTDGDRLFLIALTGLLGLPMLAMLHLWKLTHFKNLLAAFEARDGVRRQ